MKAKKLITLLFMALTAYPLSAAEKENISFKAMGLQNETPLNEDNQKRLTLKIEQAVAYNNAGANTAQSQLFVIYPEFVTTSSDVVNTGMRNIYVVRGELSLFSRNLMDDNTFATVVLPLEGSGKTEQDCYRVMINSIRGSNPQIARFISESQQRVIEYYERIMPQVLAKAERQMTALEYDNALVTLSIIPECVDGYYTVSELMSKAYAKILDRNADMAINEAKTLIVKKEYMQAIEVLSTIDPMSSKYDEAWQMIAEARTKIDAVEQAEAERRLQEIEAAKAQAEQEREQQMKILQMEYEAQERDKERAYELTKIALSGQQAKEYADTQAQEKIQTAVENNTDGSDFKTWFTNTFLK